MKMNIYTLITAFSLVVIWIFVISKDMEMSSQPDKSKFDSYPLPENDYARKTIELRPEKKKWAEMVYNY